MSRLTPTLLCLTCVLFGAANARAHKLNVFASAEGKTIRGKAYFQGGAPARNVTVTAFGPTGEAVARTKTDDAGRFFIEADKRGDYRLLAETVDGHGGEYTLRESALPNDSPAPAGSARPLPETASPTMADATPASASGEELAALRAEVVHLEEQLLAYEDRIRLTDILGGVGYIVGITGAAYYYLGTRRRRNDAHRQSTNGPGSAL